jgi:peptide/nickel transport system permease protein
MGLDEPIVVQYVVWLKDAASGVFGNSMKSNMPAAGLVLSKVPVSLELMIGAMAIALLIAFSRAASWRRWATAVASIA